MGPGSAAALLARFAGGTPAEGRGTAVATLTLNPTVDLASTAEHVQPLRKIRTTDERADAGGGGINVARVMRALGAAPQALIMTGGVTGRLIEELLDAEQVAWTRLPIAGRSRIVLNVHDRASGLDYRFIPEGPLVTAAEWRAALDRLETVEADWIVASGSLPRGVPQDFYARAAAIAARRGQSFVLDTSGPALHAAAGPGAGLALLKLSLGEAQDLAGRPFANAAERDAAIGDLVARGTARRIAVSLGPDGAVLASRAGWVRLPAPAVTARSAAGPGDSFLAALVLALAHGGANRAALALAVAAGAASAAAPGTARVDTALTLRLAEESLAAAAGV